MLTYSFCHNHCSHDSVDVFFIKITEMALFRLYIQKQCRIISSRHILHPNLNYKKNHLLWRIITSCLLLFGNGNVPSVTDTVTWFCIGFGKNINGQKTYPVAPFPIPISLFLIIHHFLFFAIYSLLSIIQVLL